MKKYKVKINKQFKDNYPIINITEDDILLEFNKNIIIDNELISIIKFLKDNYVYKRKSSNRKHFISLNKLNVSGISFIISKDIINIEKDSSIILSFIDLIYLLNYRSIMFGNDTTLNDIKDYKISLV